MASPEEPAVAALLQTHLALMRASSPACSVHALDERALASDEVRLFALEQHGGVVAIGALRCIGERHAEIKSMHVAEAVRGRGLARRILAHLLEEARGAGVTRVSLETGSQEEFAAARSLYESAGFTDCAAFEGYDPDPASVFMTCSL